MKVYIPCYTSSSGPGESGSYRERVHWEESFYKAVEAHTSPSWYCAWDSAAQSLSCPLKFSLWNSLVMAANDLPLVSGRNRPTYSADTRQTAPKGTKQYALNSLWKKSNRKLSGLCLICCFHFSCKDVVHFLHACLCTHVQEGFMLLCIHRNETSPYLISPVLSCQTVLISYFLSLTSSRRCGIHSATAMFIIQGWIGQSMSNSKSVQIFF